MWKARCTPAWPPRTPDCGTVGVKKAPFIVLIGANMPSILARFPFVSNPGDERKLRTPDYRQRIAESLYRGIAKYVSGLSGVKVASKIEKGEGAIRTDLPGNFLRSPVV